MNRPGAGAQFPQTSWTLLAVACAEGEEGRGAFEEFTRQYYEPVFAFVKAIVGHSVEDAEDLAYGFFQQKLLSRSLLKQAESSRGRFRHYLKQALRNYVIDWQRRQGRWKQNVISLDNQKKGVDLLESNPWQQVDSAFYEAWVRALLKRTIVVVESMCKSKGQRAHFEIFLGRYLNESGDMPSWSELGTKFDLDEKAARNRAETVVRHFKQVMRDLLIEDTGSKEAADEEMATLQALL
ncbi:RNA polymerase sigma factor [Thermodesulfobacteriota bacterium]